jgi:hypothetical protein
MKRKMAKKFDLLERGFEPWIFEYNSRPRFEFSVFTDSEGDEIKSRQPYKRDRT